MSNSSFTLSTMASDDGISSLESQSVLASTTKSGSLVMSISLAQFYSRKDKDGVDVDDDEQFGWDNPFLKQQHGLDDEDRINTRQTAINEAAKLASQKSSNRQQGSTRNVLEKQRSSVRNVLEKQRSSVRNVLEKQRSSVRNVLEKQRSSARNVLEKQRSSKRDLLEKQRSSARNMLMEKQLSSTQFMTTEIKSEFHKREDPSAKHKTPAILQALAERASDGPETTSVQLATPKATIPPKRRKSSIWKTVMVTLGLSAGSSSKGRDSARLKVPKIEERMW